MNFLAYSFSCCIAALQLASASKEEVACKWEVGRGKGSKDRMQISNMEYETCVDQCYRERKERKDTNIDGVTVAVEKSGSWCYCEFNMDGTDGDKNYKSCKMVFGRYKLIGEGLTCNRDTLYTLQPGKCDGWSETTAEDCRSKCTLNEAPGGCDDDASFECKYVLWKSNGLCHLGDGKCQLTTGSSDVTLYERRGAALIPNTEDCWKKCGGRGGNCESYCGNYGFCCRQGKHDCPSDLALLNPNHKNHACVRAPEHVPEEMVNCHWRRGKARGKDSGDSELRTTWQNHMTNKACILHCHNLRVITKDTAINGVTVGTNGATTCWCVSNMEDTDQDSDYWSCRMLFSGVGGMVCDDDKIDDIEESFTSAIIKIYERVSDGKRKWPSLNASLFAQMALLHKCLLKSYTSDMYCNLKKASVKFCKLSDSFKSALYLLQDPPERRPILTDTDHNTKLKSEAFKSFQKEMTLSFEEVKTKIKDVDQNFRQDFGTYLSEIADYDHQIAQQDRIYIFAIIQSYQEKIESLNKQIGKMLSDIIGILIGKATTDTIATTVRLGATLGKSFNPLGWLFGSTDPGDIEDALAQVANAVNSAIKTTHLFLQLKEIARDATTIQKGLNQNKHIHDTFFELITVNVDNQGVDVAKLAVQFSDAYGEFSPSPGLKKEDLLKFTSTLGGMLDAACDEISDSKSTAGNLVATAAFIMGYCTGTSTGPLIDELSGVFEESFEAQFEIMDIGAALAKSVISKELARKLKNEMNAGRPSLTDYAMGVLTSATYRRDVIYAACDAFEYKNFGKVNELCRRLKAEPMLNEITALSDMISDTDQLNCDENPRRILIPAYSGAVEKGHINLDNLYDGTAIFHIPNATYAKKNKWILKGNVGKSIYIKEFTLFLPPNADKEEREDEIRIHYGGPNPMNDRTFYLPPNEMVTAYTYNPLQSCTPIDIEPYSYSYCPSLFSSPTCVVRYGETKAEYLPSLYGEWYLFLMNNQNNTEILLQRLPKPQVKGKLYLQALVKTCSNAVLSGGGYIHSIGKKRDAVENRRKCCGPKGLAVNFEGDNQNLCKGCPEKSSPTLEGYYCEEKS